MTPRTTYIGIKYNYFRSKITHIGPNKIVVLWIDTKEQRSDLFKKDLTKFNFEQRRKIIMGLQKISNWLFDQEEAEFIDVISTPVWIPLTRSMGSVLYGCN